MSRAREVVLHSNEERIRRFGIECGDELLWSSGTWGAGGEYCKSLKVKNVGQETMKIKYVPPEASFFSMDFPESRTLSPGMSMQVQVVFRPVRMEPYDDHVEFVLRIRKLSWSLCIPIRARLSKVSVSVPESLDFGYTPIKEEARKSFEVANTGQVPLDFRWQVQPPFAVEPASGTIASESSTVFQAVFAPRDASVLVSKALLHVAGLPDSPVLFKLSGIGKYPFVSLSDTKVDFGSCLPGKPHVKEVVLRNQSFVPAAFTISRVERDIAAAHTVTPVAGTIPPGEAATLRVRYTPRSVGQFSCDSFAVTTPGGNNTRLESAGFCAGPVVKVVSTKKSSIVQFGEAAIGPGASGSGASGSGASTAAAAAGGSTAAAAAAAAPTRALRLANASDVPVVYQFVADPDGEFEFPEGTVGTIPARLDKAVTVRFRPRKAGNYYKRVFCVVQDQWPIYFDLVGTAFDASDEDQSGRPLPLLARHIEAHRHRELAGLDRETPDRLLELQAAGVLGAGAKGGSGFPERSDVVAMGGAATMGQLEVCAQMFRRHTDPAGVVSASDDNLDFGGASRLRGAADKKVLQVSNRHHAKVTCTWAVNWSRPGPAPFAIFPESQDVGPGGTASFRVHFQPPADNAYYCVTATAHVHLKSNRSFRLVKDAAFVPPWHLSVQLAGHTFRAGDEQFLPKLAVHVHPGAAAAPTGAAATATAAAVAALVPKVRVSTLWLSVFADAPAELLSVFQPRPGADDDGRGLGLRLGLGPEAAYVEAMAEVEVEAGCGARARGPLAWLRAGRELKERKEVKAHVWRDIAERMDRYMQMRSASGKSGALCEQFHVLERLKHL